MATPAPASPPTAVSKTRKPGEPYCASCGHSLINLTDASRCPGCGKPLVEVLARWAGESRKAKRYRSEAELFGVPIVSIAFGARPEVGERRATAVGIIAIGDVARGGIAIGRNAMGIVAIGGMATGIASIGGLSFGALTALGGMSVGGFSVGGFAIGGMATGPAAVGVVAQGPWAVGLYGRGSGVIAVHGQSIRRTDPEAVRFFDAASPVLGASGSSQLMLIGQAAGTAIAVDLVFAVAIGIVAWFGHRKWAARTARGETVSARSEGLR